jgi:hypothetical protein
LANDVPVKINSTIALANRTTFFIVISYSELLRDSVVVANPNQFVFHVNPLSGLLGQLDGGGDLEVYQDWLWSVCPWGIDKLTKLS